jgi:hypothetical protein
MTFGELTTATVAVLHLLKSRGWICLQRTRVGHGGEGVPHAQTGDAAILNYQCVNGRMTRDLYLNAFDSEGYQSAQWKPIR